MDHEKSDGGGGEGGKKNSRKGKIMSKNWKFKQSETHRKKKVMQRTELLFHIKARMNPIC